MSSSPTRRLTSLLLTPDAPIDRTRSSTLRVDTPLTYASWMTATRARSARRRGSASQSGKYEPVRVLGIASSSAPMRESNGRTRYPLRYPVRSGVRSWGAAPSCAVTSASISSSIAQRRASRSTSGSAELAACSRRVRSAILGSVIAWFLRVNVRHSLEDHAVTLAVKGPDLHHVLGHY